MAKGEHNSLNSRRRNVPNVHSLERLEEAVLLPQSFVNLDELFRVSPELVDVRASVDIDLEQLFVWSVVLAMLDGEWVGGSDDKPYWTSRSRRRG